MGESEPSTLSRRGGFWARFAATWLDAALVYGVLTVIVLAANHAGVYLPFELLFVVLFVAYSAIAVAWSSRTVGKLLCGLRVRSSTNGSIGPVAAVFRESIGKPLSCACLFVGCFWAARRLAKCAWHDYWARSIVVQDARSIGRARWMVAIAVISTAVLVGIRSLDAVTLHFDAARVKTSRRIDVQHEFANSASLIDVHSLGSGDLDVFARWLDAYGQDPTDYVVQSAATHRVTLIGEWHFIRNNLAFLNRIIPDLYHRAGVRCIAMEACVADDNADIARLVTAERFDADLALEIARHQGWRDWGWKEYWDVFETVWRLNRERAPGSENMRVIGIDSRWDGPSFALVGFGDDRVAAPWWEKLRLVRLLDADLVRISERDALMARQIEKEVLERGERAVVWIGAAHTYLFDHCAEAGGAVVGAPTRMGELLHRKYGDDVFQILLDDPYYLSRDIRALIERVEDRRQNRPVGFDVVGSPFVALSDDQALMFQRRPGSCFGDFAEGCVFLCPIAQQEHCTWVDGYISPAMFAQNEPYYEAKCGRALRDAADANGAYSRRRRSADMPRSESPPGE